MGFGGNKEIFRIWIDEILSEASHVSTVDETFEDGYLASEATSNINILVNRLCRIWKFGDSKKYLRIDIFILIV